MQYKMGAKIVRGAYMHAGMSSRKQQICDLT